MKTENRSVDRLERELVDLESLKSRITARQLELVRELDVAQVAGLDGAKTMSEWATRVLDTSAREGRALVRLARSIDPRLEADLAEGRVSTRRALAEAALAAAGASDDLLARSRGFDIAGVRRLANQLRSFTAADEITAFESRSLVLQPNLDESVYKYWGQTTGVQGRAMAKALDQRADQLYQGQNERPSRPQRLADAWDSIIDDHLTGQGTHQPSQDPLVTVFVDATGSAHAHANADASADADADADNGATESEPAPSTATPTAWVDGGVRIGPHTLEQLLCLGAVEVITVDQNLQPDRRHPHPPGYPTQTAAGHPRPRRRLRHRRLQLHPPPPTPPHHPRLPGRTHHSREPGNPVLVSPPHRHPRPRTTTRPHHPTPTTPLPPTTTRTRPTLTTTAPPSIPDSRRSDANHTVPGLSGIEARHRW